MRYQDSLNVPGASAILPPEFQPQEIDRPMRDNPEEGALLDVEFADAAHARTPPRLRLLVQRAANQENIGLVPGHSCLFNGRDSDREFVTRPAYKSDLAGG